MTATEYNYIQTFSKSDCDAQRISMTYYNDLKEG